MENLIRKSEAIELFDIRKFMHSVIEEKDEQQAVRKREEQIPVNIGRFLGTGSKDFYRRFGRKKTFSRYIVLDSHNRMNAEPGNFTEMKFNIADHPSDGNSTVTMYSRNARILSIQIYDIILGNLAQDQSYIGPDGLPIRPNRELTRASEEYYEGFNRNTFRIGLLFKEYGQYATRGSDVATGVHFYAKPKEPFKLFLYPYDSSRDPPPEGDPVPLPLPEDYFGFEGPWYHLAETLNEVSDFNQGKIEFHNPPLLQPTLTAIFRDPVDPLVFLPDRIEVTISYGSYTVLTSEVPWALVTYPDGLIVRDFTTADPEGDAKVIELINSRPHGWPVWWLSNTQLVFVADAYNDSNNLDSPNYDPNSGFPDTSNISGLPGPFVFKISTRKTTIIAKFTFIEDEENGDD
jgi:hypothetical protein